MISLSLSLLRKLEYPHSTHIHFLSAFSTLNAFNENGSRKEHDQKGKEKQWKNKKNTWKQ
jgi:hypothetical protein